MATTDITDTNFDAQVISNKLPVLVDFWAPWCGPCKLAGPALEELSETFKDKVLVMKLNIDENQAMPSKYGVMSIPTTILFKGGKEVGRAVGFSGKENFEELMKKGI